MSVFLSTLRRPICVALRNVTTRRHTIRSVGHKQGTLPWAIPPTVSVYTRLFRYTIDGWSTPRSTFSVPLTYILFTVIKSYMNKLLYSGLVTKPRSISVSGTLITQNHVHCIGITFIHFFYHIFLETSLISFHV